MTTPEERALAAGVEDVIRSVAGVSAVFRAGTTVSRLARTATALVGDDSLPLVHVELTGEDLRAEIAIGVHATAGAVETVTRVHERAADWLAQQRPVRVLTHITVVHIDDAAQ